METPNQTPSDDVTRLRLLSDLIRILAQPKLWMEGGTDRIVSTLMDALFGLMGSAFVFVRLSDGFESFKPAGFSDRGAIMDAGFGVETLLPPSPSQIVIGGAPFHIASAHLGDDDEIGIILTGSERLGFPSPSEALLLELAANQTAIAIQRSRQTLAKNGTAHQPPTLIDEIPEIVALLTPTGEIEMENCRALEFFGRSREGSTQRGLLDSIHPGDLPTFQEVFSRSMSSGIPFEAEHRTRGRDGAYRWFLTRGSPVWDAAGSLVRWCVLSTDIDVQKRGEQTLRDSELEARLIIDSIPGMVAVVNISGEIERVSRPVLDYYGKPLEELNLWMTGDGIHPEDRPRLILAFSRSLESGEPVECEVRARRFDGMHRWFQIRGQPIRDRHGVVVKWYFLQTDIDEKKCAEQALKSSRRNLELIVNTIPAVAWSADADGAAEFLSEHYLDYTGLTAETAMAWGWTAAVHPDDRNGLIENWRRIVESGQLGEAEARLRRHDGEFRWFLFRANPLRDEAGKVVRWYGTNIDIEDRRRAEEELRRKDEFFARAQEISLSGCFSWPVDTDEVNFSEGAYRIFGYEPNSRVTIARNIGRIHPDDLPLMMSMVGGARGVGDDQDYEIRILLDDGTVKYLHTTSSATILNGRRHFVGAFQDVTQRRLAEEALNRARSELAHASRVLSLNALTASIAHEINQPLLGIVTNASTCLRMLDAEPPNIGGAQETARRTLRDGNRAADVISRLRALFSKKDLVLEPMDLNDATREVITLLLNDLHRNHVIVEPKMADELPLALGDRVQIQQVVLNLLRNGSEAMTDICDRPRRLTITTEYEAGDRVRLSVSDTGIGLDIENKAKLFDSFFTSKSGGMGIGLSVSRSIIDKHHGRLWAEPNSGPGATFAFSIPACPKTVAIERSGGGSHRG